MGYAVTPANSHQFQYLGRKLAVACVADENFGGNIISIFEFTGAGWNSLVDPYGRFPLWDVTSDSIAAEGSVHNYLTRILPQLAAGLKELFLPTKPNFAEKDKCLAYDLATGNVRFDDDACAFVLDQPPLNHNA